MYGLPDRLRPLSAAEEQVMLAVWACREPATRRDIDEKLRGKGWAPATVLNFLYRLEEKGWVKSGKQGNHNIYAATVTQRAYGVWSMRQRLSESAALHANTTATLPLPCGRWSVRAAAGKANWNRP